MSLIQRNARNSESVLFVLLAMILGFSLMRSVAKADFHVMDMDATLSTLVFVAFIVIALVFAVLSYVRTGVARIPAIIVGLVAIVLGACLMASVIENSVGYAGWALVIFGIGCIIDGAYLPRMLPEEN